jgi:hypothetical protein
MPSCCACPICYWTGTAWSLQWLGNMLTTRRFKALALARVTERCFSDLPNWALLLRSSQLNLTSETFPKVPCFSDLPSSALLLRPFHRSLASQAFPTELLFSGPPNWASRLPKLALLLRPSQLSPASQAFQNESFFPGLPKWALLPRLSQLPHVTTESAPESIQTRWLLKRFTYIWEVFSGESYSLEESLLSFVFPNKFPHNA